MKIKTAWSHVILLCMYNTLLTGMIPSKILPSIYSCCQLQNNQILAVHNRNLSGKSRFGRVSCVSNSFLTWVELSRERKAELRGTLGNKSWALVWAGDVSRNRTCQQSDSGRKFARPSAAVSGRVRGLSETRSVSSARHLEPNKASISHFCGRQVLRIGGMGERNERGSRAKLETDSRRFAFQVCLKE